MMVRQLGPQGGYRGQGSWKLRSAGGCGVGALEAKRAVEAERGPWIVLSKRLAAARRDYLVSSAGLLHACGSRKVTNDRGLARPDKRQFFKTSSLICCFLVRNISPWTHDPRLRQLHLRETCAKSTPTNALLLLRVLHYLPPGSQSICHQRSSQQLSPPRLWAVLREVLHATHVKLLRRTPAAPQAKTARSPRLRGE